jgi:hypothetical protein
MTKVEIIPARRFGGSVFLLAFCQLQPGRQAVALALKWEVLAVCTVFAFVGAILLGAF